MGNKKPGFGSNPQNLGTYGGKPSNRYVSEKERRKKEDEELTAKFMAWADKAEAKQKLRDEVLVPFIHLRGMSFLDEWLIQVVSAKGDAAAPKEEESSTYWVIALLGNLLWAASCFVPGAGLIRAGQLAGTIGVTKVGSNLVASPRELSTGMTKFGKTMYATMQMGGSMAAAGTIERLTRDSSGNPTGRDVIAMQLNDRRKKMGDAFRKLVATFASEVLKLNVNGLGVEDYAKDSAKYLQIVERLLWASLFPLIDFEDFNAIYQSSLRSISGALGQFNRQYKEWKEAVPRWAMNDLRSKDNPHGILHLHNGAKYHERIAYYQRTRPFKPQLRFET